MKKLSFIMAVLMILMCLPVMAMTSASAAEEAPVASMDIKKTNGDAYTFAGAYETGLADDAAAIAAGYYWRIGA